MKLPDFLVIGAAKAGTTALFKAMSRHRTIFCSPEKEPGFFAFEGQGEPMIYDAGTLRPRRVVRLVDEYLALFERCPPEAKAGEATTAYLSNRQAPERAAHYVPSAQLIVVLRHPVERAFSQWLHLRQEGREPIPDFEAAWQAEPERVARGWSHVYHYRSRGFYGEALERWLQFFPRERLLIEFYEDWRDDPAAVLRRVWKHVGVSQWLEPVVTRENVSSRQPRWAWLQHRMTEDNALRRWAQRRLPVAVRDGITASVQAVNLVPGPRIDRALRAKLAATYDDDLRKVEALTGRDLGGWRV